MNLDKIASDKLKNIIKSYKILKDKNGMSPAQVFKLESIKDILFLKISHKKFANTTYDVKREMEVLEWVKGKFSVPSVVFYEEYGDYNFLITKEAEGREILDPNTFNLENIVDVFVQSIKKIQSIDITNCPFDSSITIRTKELEFLKENELLAINDFHEGNIPFKRPDDLIDYLSKNKPKEDFVFSHGDIDANLFIENGNLKSIIDWGRAGLADKWLDIAFCVRSIKEDFKTNDKNRYLNHFFEKLEIFPNWDKINYFLYLDELF